MTIQFAASRLIPIHYTSSAGIGIFVGDPTFPEMAIAGYPPPEDAYGYTASKWASVSVLEKAHSKLRILMMIHRPTCITGPNAPPADIFTKLFLYAKELWAVHDPKHIKQSFDIISIELVALTVVREAPQPIKCINFSNIRGVKKAPA